MASRISPAQAAEVKSAPTGSTRIRSLIALSVRRCRISWYSGEPYQSFAVFMSGNSIRTAEPDQSVQIQGRDVRLWVVPARVDGVWNFHDSQETPFTIDLRQAFGTLSGEITRGGAREALRSGTVHGFELRFTFDAAGVAAEFSGTVRGGEITGVLRTGTAARTAVGRLQGALRGAPWAEMPPGCSRYYDR